MYRESARTLWPAGLVGLTAALWSWSCNAASCPALPPKPEECRQLPDKDQRLDCYDHFADGKPWVPKLKEAISQCAESKAPESPVSEAAARPDTSTLHKDWNLAGYHEKHAPAIQTYRQNYLLLANWSDNPNRMPGSPAPDHTTTEDLDPTEVKFQFSIKSQLLDWDADFLGFNKYRLWFAYTQQSYWQFYNSKDSRPFRDNNYEPELILTLGRPDDASFLTPLKLFNIGLEHQSNGQSNPLSRSWNRLYGQADFEFGNFAVFARAWWRLPEPHATDDNPNILEYIGRGEIVGRWANDGTLVSLLLRDNFSLNPNRGFAELDVNLPFFFTRLRRDGLSLHFQATTGYGDSLLDYNHRQTTVGVGVAFGTGEE